jgi:hypothetical protein
VHVDGDKVEHEEISGDTIVFIRHNGDGDNMEKKIIIRENDGMPSNVLYLVDGKPYHKLIESLDATKIESMNVIKGADVAKYTKEPYDAVIDIKMKK